MLYRRLNNPGIDLSILGFGCMRLLRWAQESKLIVPGAENAKMFALSSFPYLLL
jgi:predicted aldo/keto reductase-like oxidoreductase